MAHTDNSRDPRHYGPVHLAMSLVATISLVLILLSSAGIWSGELATIGFVLGALSIIVMFAPRNSDEWIASLWTTGADAGFVVAMSWLVLGPFAEGFYDGMTASPRQQDLPPLRRVGRRAGLLRHRIQHQATARRLIP